MPTLSVFAIEAVQDLRRRAIAASSVPEDCPEGCSKSLLDPMKLLAVFPSLRLQAEFVLRAYQFREGGNGNGIVWAMPGDLPFPEPDDCPTQEGVFLQPPKPPGALDDFRAALEGDGSPWSYLSASLFAREAFEFGALWHGSTWGDHALLGSDPWSGSGHRIEEDACESPFPDPAAWRWRGQRRADWQPAVETRGRGETAKRRTGETEQRIQDTFQTRKVAVGRGREAGRHVYEGLTWARG